MIKYSSPFMVPKAPEIVYRNELYKLIKAMIKDYKALIPIYRDKKEQVAMDAEGTWLTTEITEKMKKLGNKWAEKFGEYADTHSKKYVEKLARMSATQIKFILKDWLADERLELFGQVIPNQIKQVMKAHIEQNVSLIKSIAPQYHERVFGTIMRSITGNGSIRRVRDSIFKYGNMSMRRAKMIANDQTRKVYSNITLHNCQHLGIRKMMWKHSHAVKDPRHLHIRKWDGVSSPQNPNGLDGLIFDIDKPPLIQEATAKSPAIYGYPTDLPNCSCYMRAVLE